MPPGMLKSDFDEPHALGAPAYDVVIPCYNRAGTVKQSVISVFDQSKRPSRIILVDDGSVDGTAEILTGLERRHREVQAVLLPRNMGASAARDAGLALV